MVSIDILEEIKDIDFSTLKEGVFQVSVNEYFILYKGYFIQSIPFILKIRKFDKIYHNSHGDNLGSNGGLLIFMESDKNRYKIKPNRIFEKFKKRLLSNEVYNKNHSKFMEYQKHYFREVRLNNLL